MFDDFFRILSETKYKAKYGEGLKILTPKQVLERIPVVLAQIKAGDASKNLLNEMRQIIHFLHQTKEITKKVYNNIMNSIKTWNRMDTISMNSENSKTSDLHWLLPNFTDETNLNRSDKYIALSNLKLFYHDKLK